MLIILNKVKDFMSNEEDTGLFCKEKLLKMFSFIDKKEWNEAKTIWALEFLKLNPGQTNNFSFFNDSFSIFGKILSYQQKYSENLSCSECNIDLGVSESDFLVFSRDQSKEIQRNFYITCRKCQNSVKSKFRGNFCVKPGFLYCEMFYSEINDSTTHIKCHELPKLISLNNLNFKLLLAQIYINNNHFKGIFLLDEKFVLIDDLQHGNKRLRVPKEHKVTCCLYFIV
jgi:hypothetical protein